MQKIFTSVFEGAGHLAPSHLQGMVLPLKLQPILSWQNTSQTWRNKAGTMIMLKKRWQQSVLSIIIILVFCVCVCLFVPSEISWMGCRSAALLTPMWRASPGELNKLLLKLIQRTVREKKALKFFRGYALMAVYPRENFRLRWAWSILLTKF